MTNLYISFSITVSDDEYSYRGTRGSAEAKFAAPRFALVSLDVGNLFAAILQAALNDFDTVEEDTDAEKPTA